MDKSSIQALLREGITAAKLAQQKSASADVPSARPIRRLTAAKVNQRERARELLLRVTELDEQNILAWLWLSTVVDTPEEKQTCLENVLTLDPNNKHALTGLTRLKQTAPVPEPTPEESPRTRPPSRPTGSKYARLKPRALAQPQPSPAENVTGVSQAQRARTEPTTPACPFCRQSISGIDKTCPHCQLPLVMSCPACGTSVDVEQRTCWQCDGAMGNYRQPLNYFARLGAAYQENQRYEAAVKAWQAVETLQPNYPQLQIRLGEAHLGMGRPDRAWESLQRALEQNPDAVEVHFALGELARQRGEHQEAFDHYQTAGQLDPQHGLTWFQLGQIYQQSRMRKEAIQAYRRAAKLLPAGSTERRQAQDQLERLTPSLPENMVTGWPELIRQMIGPVTLCVLAVLLDSGLRPWWIPLTGWLALMLAVSGTFLYVSGTDLPRNPLIRLLAGERGLSSSELKIILVLVGAVLWLFALALILLPLGGQSYPEPPQL